MPEATTVIGEVVEASTGGFTAQCHRLGEPPALGSLVVTAEGDVEIYGVVCNAATVPIDPSRKVTALGQNEQSEAAILAAHPELQQLLRTDFQAIVVGHRNAGAVHHCLPPRPARIHAFVRQATSDQVRDFTRALHFLPFLVNASAPARDDAAAACLLLASRAHADPNAFLLHAGKSLAALLAQDAPRLHVLLRLLRG